MSNHPVAEMDQWLEARRELLQKEKEMTRMRDELSRMQRALPWVKVEKDYRFQGPDGEVSLSDLFEGKSQLIVYHFMFDPEWDEGCKSCSFCIDHLDPMSVHLEHRDVALALVSRAPLAKLEAFKKRMGWSLPWVSSLESDFNWDFRVSFTPEDQEKNAIFYNFGPSPYFSSEGPGMSVFAKDTAGAVYHTYSTYARGLEELLGTYRLLDVVPKGRDEDELPYGMAWICLKDSYED